MNGSKTLNARNQFDSYDDHLVVATSRKMAYGMGAVSVGIADLLVNTFLITYYTVILKLNPGWVGFALIWPRLLDAFIDPIMGQVSDRTRTRWGRRRPYLLFGGPILSICTLILFAPSNTFSPHVLAVYLCISAGLYYICYTIFTVPFNALGAELALDYNERTRVYTWRTALYTAAGFIAPWTWWLAQRNVFPNEETGVKVIVAIMAGLILMTAWLCFWGTREQQETQDKGTLCFWAASKETLSNKTFLLLALVVVFFYCGLYTIFSLANFVSIYYVFGGTDHQGAAAVAGLNAWVSSAVSIASIPVWGWLGTRIGKRNGYILGLLFLAVVSPLSWLMFTPIYPRLQLLCNALIALAFNGTLIFPFAMLADICDLDELKTGARREGSYNGVMGFLIKCGFSLPAVLSGLLLNGFGFKADLAVQAPETIFQMRLCLAALPSVICLLVIVPFWFYPLSEKRVREIRQILEHRRQSQELATAVPAGEAAV